MDAYMAKHEEFEAHVASAGVESRSIEKNARGIPQHVVHLKMDGLLRWPLAYEHGKAAWLEAAKDADAPRKGNARD